MSVFVPVERKRVLGNPGGRPLPQPIGYLEAAEEIPEPPEHLKEHGLEVWNRVWRSASAWISPTTDIAIMIRYAETYDLREELKSQIADEGLTVVTKTSVRPHPLLSVLKETDAALTKYESLLGLTPADRGKMGLTEVKTRTGVASLEGFLEKKGNE